MGSVEVAYGVLYRRTVFPLFLRENTRNLFIYFKLNNFPLFTSFSLYIFRK